MGHDLLPPHLGVMGIGKKNLGLEISIRPFSLNFRLEEKAEQSSAVV
jgi:hypothetical protein